MLTRDELFPNRVAGVIRTDDPEAAFRACMAAVDGGIGTIEVSMSIPSCLDIVRGLMASTGGSIPVGVGTVWDVEDVSCAKQAGAAFVATSVVLPEVATACAEADILCILGALTPTEIHRARLAGADVINLFPIQAMGGPEYVRSLQGPLPGIPFWVSGGIEVDQIEDYLALGVAAITLGPELFPPDAVRRGDLGLITALARRASASIGAVWA